MEQVNVIKVGGAVVENADTLAQLLADFSALPGAKVLVHGGGRSATQVAANLGIESQMVGGRRITDEAMLRVVTMVYGGLVNKNVVARLQALGVQALGLTGADADLIRSHRRPVGEVDYGWVGDVDRVRGDLLATLIRQGIVPVVAPLTHDGEGHMLNTNADTIASEVACALTPFFDVTLTFCFEKRGLLRNPDDEESVVPFVSEADFAQLKAEGVVSGGMVPKLENAFQAIRRGVRSVVITRADHLDGQGGTCLS